MKRPTLKVSAEIMERESYLSDESVLDKAMTAKNGEKFKKLWEGEITGYPSQSEADQALCSILAFYCNGNYEQIDRLFRLSGLIRDKPLCTNPPYGYIKDPEDKTHWIVDEEAAVVVKEIFHLCISGLGPTKIANELEKRKIEHPVAYGKRKGIAVPAKQAYDDPYIWRDSTIARMLSRQEYLGHTVNFKTRRKSYKQKKKIKNDPSEWQVFENTHESIIDEETFNIVQKIRDGRRRLSPMGEMGILSGMMFCADCGNKLYQVRGRGWEHDKEYFVCATYRKKKGGCSSHQIRNIVVEQLLLHHLQQVTTFAREHEDEFISLVTDTSERELERELKDSRKEYEQAKTRFDALDNIIQKLYEDNVIGKISDERFMKLTATYETEQAQLQNRVIELQQFLDSAKEKSLNAEHFLSLVWNYTDIKELDAEIIRQFIEKIVVYKAEKVDGSRQQHIEVIFNCIGAVELPKPQEKTA